MQEAYQSAVFQGLFQELRSNCFGSAVSSPRQQGRRRELNEGGPAGRTSAFPIRNKSSAQIRLICDLRGFLPAPARTSAGEEHTAFPAHPNMGALIVMRGARSRSLISFGKFFPWLLITSIDEKELPR
jgi:hypothetical protein